MAVASTGEGTSYEAGDQIVSRRQEEEKDYSLPPWVSTDPASQADEKREKNEHFSGLAVQRLSGR